MTCHTRLWDGFCQEYGIRNVDTVTDIAGTGILFSLMTVGRVDSDELQYEADWFSSEGDAPSRYSVHLIPSRSLWTVMVDGIIYHDTLGEFIQSQRLTSERRPSTGLMSPLSLVYFEGFPETWGGSYRFQKPFEDGGEESYPRHFEVADRRYLRVISYAGGSQDSAEEVFEIVIDMSVPIVYYKCRHLDECIDSLWKLRFVKLFPSSNSGN